MGLGWEGYEEIWWDWEDYERLGGFGRHLVGLVGERHLMADEGRLEMAVNI